MAKKWYEKDTNVYQYITTKYRTTMNESLERQYCMYMSDIGLRKITLYNFVVRFNLQDLNFSQLVKFAIDPNNRELILGYYSNKAYCDMNNREYTNNENYKYGKK